LKITTELPKLIFSLLLRVHNLRTYFQFMIPRGKYYEAQELRRKALYIF